MMRSNYITYFYIRQEKTQDKLQQFEKQWQQHPTVDGAHAQDHTSPTFLPRVESHVQPWWLEQPSQVGIAGNEQIC